jgi:hypothetical protein
LIIYPTKHQAKLGSQTGITPTMSSITKITISLGRPLGPIATIALKWMIAGAFLDGFGLCRFGFGFAHWQFREDRLEPPMPNQNNRSERETRDEMCGWGKSWAFGAPNKGYKGTTDTLFTGIYRVRGLFRAFIRT